MVFILISEKHPSEEGGKHTLHKQHPNIPQSDSSEKITDKVICIENKLHYTYLMARQGQSSRVEYTATNLKANARYQPTDCHSMGKPNLSTTIMFSLPKPDITRTPEGYSSCRSI